MSRIDLMGPNSPNSRCSFFSVASKLSRPTNRVLNGSPCAPAQRLSLSQAFRALDGRCPRNHQMQDRVVTGAAPVSVIATVQHLI